MANLKTSYMGLELKNPIIVGASNLTADPENLKKIENAGAAAIVYKSLFEEQVQLENLENSELKTEYEDRNAEMVTLFPGSASASLGPLEFLMNLKKAKESVSIPVFASLNAVNDETWVEYAVKLQETGIDGIELNFYAVPEYFDKEGVNVEKHQLRTLLKVKGALKIPVAVKLSPFYTNALRFISDLDRAGADGVVLFNRLLQPDIDTEKGRHIFPYSLSHPDDNRLPMRFAGLLYGNINSSLCANSGIFSGNDVIKMILAGAGSVQVVSTIYRNNVEVIGKMLADIEKWMDECGYENIRSFRGRLSRNVTENKLPYQRAQYVDLMMNSEELLRKYKVIN